MAPARVGAAESVAGPQATARIEPKDRRDNERGALTMRTIPLHLERKFERRWAARFVSPVAPAAPKSTDVKGTVSKLLRPAKAKEKPAKLSNQA